MGTISSFLDKFKKPNSKNATQPAQATNAPSATKKSRVFNFAEVFFACRKQHNGSVVATPIWVDVRRWQQTDLLTGKTTKLPPETSFLDDQPLTSSHNEMEIKRLLAKKHGDILTSSEAIVARMGISSADPYKLKQTPGFSKKTTEEKLAIVAQHTAKTLMPLPAILNQNNNLSRELTINELETQKRSAEEAVKKAEALLNELHTKISTPPTPNKRNDNLIKEIKQLDLTRKPMPDNNQRNNAMQKKYPNNDSGNEK